MAGRLAFMAVAITAAAFSEFPALCGLTTYKHCNQTYSAEWFNTGDVATGRCTNMKNSMKMICHV